ncbi:hypothetical protein BTO30_15350 [Domibacillus antri]|uniref:Uncharacterized protein n=1 Tax=Domibacillus antri TaxID=1714264 RepID=A0A1Q8Q236_9BACI|nr:tyrosine-type recombinase/integrase [Domibacillus antri]OLN21371.1 hypothetical protein BTO30_15350 [Domibacillus antri]
MTTEHMGITEEIEWNVPNASTISGEENYLKGDFIDEPALLITRNIRFSDNTWDISDKLHPEVPSLDFSLFRSKVFRVLLKKVVLRELFILRKSKRNVTVYDKTFNTIKRFILYLEKEKYMYDLRYLSPEIIKEYVENLKKTNITKDRLNRLLAGVKKFLQEVQLAGHEIDLSEYEKKLTVSWEERKAEMEANKTSNIPKRIFNQTVQCALMDMEDESLRIQDRMMACLIVILSHTGMRRGELERLEVDKLSDITILDKKEKAYYLEFFTYKTTPSKDGRWTKTIAFANTIKAYQLLEKLSKKRREKGKNTYLYVNRSGKKYGRSSFDYLFDTFFYRHQKEIFHHLSDYEIAQVHIQKVTSYLVSYIDKSEPNPPIIGETMFTLNAHQFRVAVANILKDKGRSIQWIRQHMNHLSEEMTQHYFRDDDILVRETLMRRAKADGNSLELEPNNQNTLVKNELSEPELLKAYEEINKFLKKKKFNIYKDIDDIINTLKHNPLRENIVGVCTKHLGILCECHFRV